MFAILMFLGVAWAEPNAGDKISVEVRAVTFEMSYAPTGAFQMGSPESEAGRGDNETLHTVTLTRAFYISTTEVTQALYEEVTGAHPSKEANDPAFLEDRTCKDCPVIAVSWLDAVRFCNALSKREALQEAYSISTTESGTTVTQDMSAEGYRLPTEAEWEYAARAGETHLYSGSDSIDPVAFYRDNSDWRYHPVATKRANAWGLHDMSGNVMEWVWDWYEDYPAGGATDPEGSSDATWRIGATMMDTSGSRVARGGSYGLPDKMSRAAYRTNFGPHSKAVGIGFRIVRTAG